MPTRLTTDLLTKAAMAKSSLEAVSVIFEVAGQVAQLYEKVKVFEAVVWFPHLQGLVDASDAQGMRGACLDITVLTWCCAGRCLIQLERGDARLTLITADDQEPWAREMAHVAPAMGPMGIQGIDAGFLDALRMLYECTRYGHTIDLSPDPGVTIGQVAG